MAKSVETRQSLPRRKRGREEAHPSTSYDRPAKRSRKGHAKKPYIKGSLLGQGSFGSVYAGTRRLDRLPVAIKYATKDEDTLELEVDGQGPMPLEVALMKRVNAAPACPNIIQLVKWFDRPTQYIMILERQDTCQDLSVFCAENGRLDESLAKKVLVQLISALKHCESRGVLHRDVKPDNLLICTATHGIKLLDFGCGDVLKDSAYTTFAGTYAPPEWYHYRQYHAGPATVWSVGVTLYSILCRSYPFRTGRVTFKTRLSFTRDLSLECRQLIRWCLSAEAEDRPSLEDIEQHPWLQSTGPLIHHGEKGQSCVWQADTGGHSISPVVRDFLPRVASCALA